MGQVILLTLAVITVTTDFILGCLCDGVVMVPSATLIIQPTMTAAHSSAHSLPTTSSIATVSFGFPFKIGEVISRFGIAQFITGCIITMINCNSQQPPSGQVLLHMRFSGKGSWRRMSATEMQCICSPTGFSIVKLKGCR